MKTLTDKAISRLIRAHRRVGAPVPRRPGRNVKATLAEIADRIAPLRLPADVATYWQRIDPHTLPLTPYPLPISPAFALESWAALGEQADTPRLLFPVCYQARGYLFVELEDGHGNGGALVHWGFDTGRYTVAFPSFTAYLDLLGTMIATREFARHTHDGRTRYTFDPDRRWADAQAVRLADAMPIPGHGFAQVIADDPALWPGHWVLSEHLGATAHFGDESATIADLLRVAEDGMAATGTIRGRVVRMAGLDDGDHVTVDDGTAQLELWCPADVCLLAPVIAGDFEFDVVVPANPQLSALAGLSVPTLAQVTAIRPVG